MFVIFSLFTFGIVIVAAAVAAVAAAVVEPAAATAAAAASAWKLGPTLAVTDLEGPASGDRGCNPGAREPDYSPVTPAAPPAAQEVAERQFFSPPYGCPPLHKGWGQPAATPLPFLVGYSQHQQQQGVKSPRLPPLPCMAVCTGAGRCLGTVLLDTGG